MTTPTATLYASIADLRLVLDSTDAGSGTAAQLTDEQLTLALQAATDRVSMYVGAYYDPSAVPPLAQDLTLDLAAWWATTYYLKQKDMGPNNPVVLRYTEAMKVLNQVRQGLVDLNIPVLDPSQSAATGASGGHVINRIPNIFTGDDSNTAVQGDDLIVSVPADMWVRPVIINNQWIEYTG